MEKRKNKRTLITAVSVAVFLLAGAAILTVFMTEGGSIAAMSFGNTGNAKLTVNVLEGYTNTPVEGAKVVIFGNK